MSFCSKLSASVALIFVVAFVGSQQGTAGEIKGEAGSDASSAAKVTPPLVLTSSSGLQEDKEKRLDMNALRRMDCRVEGSTCAACLGRIRKRIDKLDAVLKAAVSIKKPYGLVAIYDSTRTNKDKILEEGMREEKSTDLKFLDVQDEACPKPPLVLWPKYNSLIKTEK